MTNTLPALAHVLAAAGWTVTLRATPDRRAVVEVEAPREPLTLNGRQRDHLLDLVASLPPEDHPAFLDAVADEVGSAIAEGVAR